MVSTMFSSNYYEIEYHISSFIYGFLQCYLLIEVIILCSLLENIVNETRCKTGLLNYLDIEYQKSIVMWFFFTIFNSVVQQNMAFLYILFYSQYFVIGCKDLGLQQNFLQAI